MGDFVYENLCLVFWVILVLLGIIGFCRLNGGIDGLWFVKYLKMFG